MAERRAPRKPKVGSENEFRARVMKLAKDHGWLRMHPLRAQLPPERGGGWTTNTAGEKGYPDLTLVHPRYGRVVFLELKSDSGRADPLQLVWIAALQRCTGVEAYVVAPRDWSEVQYLLSRPWRKPATGPVPPLANGATVPAPEPQ